jgi:hypothetical protein
MKVPALSAGHRGTESSNPFPSSKESANFQSLSGGRIGVRTSSRRTQVAIICAGPAGPLLGQLLRKHGIGSGELERVDDALAVGMPVMPSGRIA